MRAWLVMATCMACSKGPVDVGFFGSAIAPPPPLDKLRPGMGEKEAKQLVPALVGQVDEQDIGKLTYELDRRGVEVELLFGHRGLESIHFNIDRGDFLGELEASWGRGRPVERSIVEWEGPHWRGAYSCTPTKTACGVGFTRLKRPLTAAFFGKSVGPPGPLAPVKLGMAGDEVRRLGRHPGRPKPWVSFDTNLDRVDAMVFLGDADQVNAIKLTVYDAGPAAKAMLEDAWGPGRPIVDRDRSRTCWSSDVWLACIGFDDGKSLQLGFDRYLPLDRLLDASGPIFGTVPVLGATRAQLATRGSPLLGLDRFTDRGALPENELGHASIELRYDGDVVGSFELVLYLTDAKQGPRVLEAIAKKWGAPRKLPKLRHSYEAYEVPAPHMPHVLVEDGGTFWSVRASQKPIERR